MTKQIFRGVMSLLIGTITVLGVPQVSHATVMIEQTMPLYISGLRDGSVSSLSTGGILTPLAYVSSQNALAIDPSSNIYIAVGSGKIGGDIIDKITPGGAVSTYASGLTSVSSIAFDGAGNLYVTYETHGQIIKITPSGAQSVFATLPGESEALAFDSKGNLFAGTLDGYVYKITTSGSVSQFSSQKIAANRVAIDSSDDLYYTVGAQVDKLSPTGTFTTFGTGSNADNLGGVAVDNAGNVFVTDEGSSGGTLGVFGPTGAYQTVENLSAISAISQIVFPPSSVPEPSMITAAIFGGGILASRRPNRLWSH